jgi:NADH pyrophosphatase NudC (nudix superfamily)
MSARLVRPRPVAVEYFALSRMASMKSADARMLKRAQSESAVIRLARFCGRRVGEEERRERTRECARVGAAERA